MSCRMSRPVPSPALWAAVLASAEARAAGRSHLDVVSLYLWAEIKRGLWREGHGNVPQIDVLCRRLLSVASLGETPLFLCPPWSVPLPTARAPPTGVRDLAARRRRERLQQAHHLHQPLPLAAALLPGHQPPRPAAVQGGFLPGTSPRCAAPPQPPPQPPVLVLGPVPGPWRCCRWPAGRCTPSGCASRPARRRERRRSSSTSTTTRTRMRKPSASRFSTSEPVVAPGPVPAPAVPPRRVRVSLTGP